MPTTAKTYDANDDLVTYTEETQQITVSYEDSRTSYGAGVKAGVHIRVPLLPTEDVDAKTAATFAQAKTLVDGALKDAPAPSSETVAPKSAGPGPKRASNAVGGRPTPEALDAAWRGLQANPTDFFDNRFDKRNPKAPDFKGRDKGQFPGVGLWLDGAPDWFDQDGLAF